MMGVDAMILVFWMLSFKDFVCSLPMQVPYSFLPVLPPRWGGDAPVVDLMASQADLVLYCQALFDLRFSSDATWGGAE